MLMAPRRWLRLLSRAIMALLPSSSFRILHYAYFIVVCLVASLIFWGASNPPRSVSYVDSLFMCVSAMTGAGLNSVAASSLSTFQQVIMFLLLMLGHAILVSIAVLFIRKRAFQRKFRKIEDLARRSSQGALAFNFPVDRPLGNERNKKNPPILNEASGQTTSSDSNIHQTPVNYCHRQESLSAGVDLQDAWQNPALSNDAHLSPPKRFLQGTQKYFESRGFISRDSQFHGLTTEERETLQGVEYKAVSFLLVVVTLYWVLFLGLGIVGMGTWLEVNKPEIPRENGLSRFWTGAFFAVSAFVNSGMGILDANMTALQTSTYPVITMGILILAGNTLFPCFLRFVIWSMRRAMPNRPSWKTWRATLDFILDHPRRVYTNLFPAPHTWYLLGTIIVLNGIDWAGFEVLSIGNKEIEALPTGYRILDGLFQALAVRAGGFSVVNIGNLSQGLLVLYVLMMYVSPFPVLITMRDTNIYKERSLGIFAGDKLHLEEYNREASQTGFMRVMHGIIPVPKGSRRYFVREQLREQLSHDLWWISLAVFLISIIESGNYKRDPVGYSTFNILFEVVTAYGCVGISTGYPGTNTSFCGVWHSLSKLILAAVTLRGCHRGLPVAIDRAIMLPSESTRRPDEEALAARQDKDEGGISTAV